MRSFNTYYISHEMFLEFVYENDLDEAQNVLVQIFSSKLDNDTLEMVIDSVSSSIPNSSIIGATTDGEIADGFVTTNEIVVSCSVFEQSFIRADYIEREDFNDFSLGFELAKKLVSKKTKLLILFADGIHTNGEDFLNGVYAFSPDIIVAGGLAGDGATFSGTKVFCQSEIIDSGAVGVAIDSDVLTVLNNYHFGWQRIGPVMEITKSEKNVVYEINGKSAYDIYKYYLGDNAAKKLPAIGIEFPLIKEKDGVDIARAVLSKNSDNSLTFAGNIDVGEKVQLGFGNIHEILRTSSKDDVLISKSIESIFIYSCMARRRFLQNDIALELQIFARNNIYNSGFFTYGEFYKNKNSYELLNQTMTIIALSEKSIEAEDNINNSCFNPYVDFESKSDTMIALSHLVNVTSREFEKSNLKLQENVNRKTIELQEKILELQKAT
ncbi:MAG: FIST C-terminal domain-containing protein, partial [Campylobacterales bacterium]|nr:FIST C-terminal domain-containing protein [Campylobacterales bacterium]